MGPQGKHMVLDGATVANLELLTNSTGGQEAALINLFSPVTAMGKRLLTQWILSPLLQPRAIRARQAAIQDLMNAQQLEQMRSLLKKFPDLERLLSKVHAAGDKVKSEKHPDSRAVFFEAERYSKRKIWDMLSLLEGFKQCKGLVELLSSLSTKSKLLQEVSKLGVNGGQFPDLEPITDFFDASFDHQKARADGKISPKTGDLDELDEASADLMDHFATIMEPLEASEPNSVELEVTGDMTRDEVVHEILRRVQQMDAETRRLWGEHLTE